MAQRRHGRLPELRRVQPKARTGVVVLSNASTLAGPDDIGYHLLDPKRPLLARNSPLLAAPKPRTEVAVDPTLYDGYVGRYQFAPAVLLTVTRDGNRLFAQLTGQPAFEVFPETAKDYFLKVVDAQLTFETDTRGKAIAVVLHQLGRDQRATRIDEPCKVKSFMIGVALLLLASASQPAASDTEVWLVRSAELHEWAAERPADTDVRKWADTLEPLTRAAIYGSPTGCPS